MERIIVPSKLKGNINAPSSKSMTQRAIAASLLAEGESTILNPSYCDDSLAAMTLAVGLGARVNPGIGEMKITGAGELREKKLNCGESGLAIRMFSPIAALYPAEIILTGAGSLKRRPMSMIENALKQFGVRCISEGGFLPLTIEGPLKGGNCEIDGSVSSQLLTGLLMALPVAEKDSEVIVNNLKSKPYIDMTLQVLGKFGIKIKNDHYKQFIIKGNQKYKPTRFEVESDWSGGAFLLVAGAITGHITVNGLNPGSRQSDKAILTALDKAGAKMTITNNAIEIKKSELKAFEFDASESPDLFPPLAVLAAYSKGVSGINGVSRLIHKESNRAVALVEELGKMGIKVEISDDYLLITGGKVKGTHVNSHDDHRIAMAAAVAGLGATDKVYIKDSHCIGKSYPGFFDDLRSIGAEVYE
ncbi:MAG: 3-phosphoshikimate 1-carboxyvinyltransferase [Bacteroidales bacterium]|jgi:3-phosphoshikimate 1-carboxyvinyltransferase|nr:3-phosphoshikimate 1-carboxyvinyltransferase [Bacteroidales bacterium]